MRWYRTIATMSPSMRYGGRRECYKQQKDILTKPSGRRQQPLVFIAPPGERHAARGHGYATDEQKNYLYTKIYVFIFMMKYLEMNIKSKNFLTKQYALRLETNTRKIKSNIDKYTI